MTLGGSELLLALIVVLVGLTGNLKLKLNRTERIKQIKWSFSIYGIAILILLCGLLTPPDILSNIVLSGPLTIIYIIILRKIGFKRLNLN